MQSSDCTRHRQNRLETSGLDHFASRIKDAAHCRSSEKENRPGELPAAAQCRERLSVLAIARRALETVLQVADRMCAFFDLNATTSMRVEQSER